MIRTDAAGASAAGDGPNRSPSVRSRPSRESAVTSERSLGDGSVAAAHPGSISAALVTHACQAVQKVDIAHSGQTVSEAMAELEAEIKHARRSGVTTLLVVHGFGASGVGGAIKAAVATELPGLARQYGFKAYGHADKDRIPREQNVDPRRLNAGSTLLVFREAKPDKESKQDFRPNFRNLRSKVKVVRGSDRRHS